MHLAIAKRGLNSRFTVSRLTIVSLGFIYVYPLARVISSLLILCSADPSNLAKASVIKLQEERMPATSESVFCGLKDTATL